jgi:hypothetical protein
MGLSSFTSHPRGSVLRIFIALKNISPWLGSNPQPLDPVASTLTTTPLRQPPDCGLPSLKKYIVPCSCGLTDGSAARLAEKINTLTVQ